MSEENERLPRIGLREHRFRKYEELIARVAKHGGLTINPKEFGEGRASAITFITQFNDAMLGFEKFKYVSDKIPRGFSRKTIKCYERRDGSVEIENNAMKMAANASQTMNNEILPGGQESVTRIIEFFGKPEGKGKFAVDLYAKIECANQEDGEIIRDFIQEQRPDLQGDVNAARGWVTFSKRVDQP